MTPSAGFASVSGGNQKGFKGGGSAHVVEAGTGISKGGPNQGTRKEKTRRIRAGPFRSRLD